MESTGASSSPDRTTLALMGALAFCILSGYALARPATESLFLEHFSSQSLPMVWGTVALVVIAVVALYNRASSRLSLYQLFVRSVIWSVVALLGLTAASRWGGASLERSAVFALYIWKDVYIVLLIEIFWSYANVLYRSDGATWVYGLFCAMGSLGGMSGNYAVGQIARSHGTEAALWQVIPLLGVACLVFFALQRRHGSGRPNLSSDTPARAVRVRDSLALLRGSRYLALLLALIAVVQVVITLIDFEFNSMLESSYPQTDERTRIIGLVYLYIDGVSLGLQLLAGAAIKLLGVRGILLLIPLLLAAALVSFQLVAVFFTMAIAKVASKSFDYSLFRAAKELLYIPLSYEEKTQGKALVDILIYRVAKGASSVFLMGMVALGIADSVGWFALALLALWVAITRGILARYHPEANGTPSDTPARATT